MDLNNEEKLCLNVLINIQNKICELVYMALSTNTQVNPLNVKC